MVAVAYCPVSLVEFFCLFIYFLFFLSFKSLIGWSLKGLKGSFPFSTTGHVLGGNPVVKFVNTFLKICRLPPYLNRIKMVLIPKSIILKLFRNFWPTHPLEIYKVLSKLLGNRFKYFLDDIIHPCQSWFVLEGRATELLVRKWSIWLRISKGHIYRNFIL